MFRRTLHILGAALGVAGMGFVGFRMRAYWEEIDFSALNSGSWLLLGVLSVVYCAANLSLSRAWWNLLCFGNITTSWCWAVKAYGLSQIAKYVPGNIVHLAGRQAFGMAVGLPTKALVRSSVWEIGLLALAGILFGPLTLPLIWEEIPSWLSVLLFGMLALVFFYLLKVLISPLLSNALAWQMFFLAIAGAVFVFILRLLVHGSTEIHGMMAVSGAYVVAWLAGLVTPGAPAGVGIREMVLLLLLQQEVAEAELIMAVVLGRIITVAGDALFFVVVATRGGLLYERSKTP